MASTAASLAIGPCQEGGTILDMRDDRESRLLDALRRLRELAHEMHRQRYGSPDRLRMEQRLDDQRKFVERLADDFHDKHQSTG